MDISIITTDHDGLEADAYKEAQDLIVDRSAVTVRDSAGASHAYPFSKIVEVEAS